MHLDLVSLKLFVAVCEQQSFVRAANRENIAASAISKRMSDLEGLLKSRLLLRTSKGLEVTPAGDTLLYHARLVIADVQNLENDLADHARGVRGRVRIHAGVSSIVQHLPQDISDFLTKHGQIRIDVEEGASEDIVRSIADNEADIGIFGGFMPLAGLRVRPYRSDRLAVIVPCHHPLSERTSVKFADLMDHDFIGPRKGSFLDTLFLRAATDLDRPLNLRMRVCGFEAVRSMVQVGLGLGVVPQQCAEQWAGLRGVAQIRLDEEWAVRDWKVCVRDVDALAAPVRLLFNHLSSVAIPHDAIASG